jgi:hypothetical protein
VFFLDEEGAGAVPFTESGRPAGIVR